MSEPTLRTFIFKCELRLTPNIKDILKIKENFPNLSLKKIEEIHKTINKSRKTKPHINITTKGPSCRQIIVPMGNNNINKFISSSSKHIANINRVLKNIKSDMIANFIHADYYGLIITSNKVVSQSDLSIIENYIKNTSFMGLDDIKSPCFLQSKLYLKILEIPYIIERTNIFINSSMAIIWINICDAQSGKLD